MKGDRAGVRRIGWPSVVAVLLAVSAGASGADGTPAAQLVADPTRPPPGYDAAPRAGNAGRGSGGPMLQSILISPAGRSAMINGVVVKLGESYGDAVLVAVNESEVVLRRGAERQVLRLYPDVDKRAARPDRDKAGGAKAKPDEARSGDQTPIR